MGGLHNAMKVFLEVHCYMYTTSELRTSAGDLKCLDTSACQLPASLTC